MVLLTQRSPSEMMLQSLLNLAPDDLHLVACDGVLSTSKLVMLNTFPLLSEYLPDWIIRYDNIKVLLPGQTKQRVGEAFGKMVISGDCREMGIVLGFEEENKTAK